MPGEKAAIIVKKPPALLPHYRKNTSNNSQ